MNEQKSPRVFNFETKFNVPIPVRPTAFKRTPLITPERLRAEWRMILTPANSPKWVRLILPVHVSADDETESGFPGDVTFVVGKKHLVPCRLPTPEYAVLCEMTRFGHSIVTNSNFNGDGPQIYVKMSFLHAPKDLMSIRRILWGAKADEATKPFGSRNDYGSDNTYAEFDPHPAKDARAVALAHVEGLAREREAGGTLPKGFSVAAYLTNINNLFRLIDSREA